MGANDRQVDGNHYNNGDYQHWDFVCDTEMHYLLACSTKYIYRHQDKNGLIDLNKSKHYIEKAKDEDLVPMMEELTDALYNREFDIIHPHPLMQSASKLLKPDSNNDADCLKVIIFMCLFCGEWDLAIDRIDDLIEKEYPSNQ